MTQYELNCMSTDGCTGGFSVSQRRLFLDDKLTAALDRIEYEVVLRLSGIENLEKCPFCPFAAEYPPVEVDREFRCGNEECQAVSCRLCRDHTHIPQSCEEAAKDRGLSARQQIEEAMSAALIRKCNKCHTPFIKEYGCNKMTCTRPGCLNIQCYICSKSCSYDHFNDPTRGGKVGNCPLFDSHEERHEAEVSEAEKLARKRIAEENPQIDEEHLRITMSQRVAEDEARRRDKDQYAGMNAQARAQMQAAHAQFQAQAYAQVQAQREFIIPVPDPAAQAVQRPLAVPRRVRDVPAPAGAQQAQIPAPAPLNAENLERQLRQQRIQERAERMAEEERQAAAIRDAAARRLEAAHRQAAAGAQLHQRQRGMRLFPPPGDIFGGGPLDHINPWRLEIPARDGARRYVAGPLDPPLGPDLPGMPPREQQHGAEIPNPGLARLADPPWVFFPPRHEPFPPGDPRHARGRG